MRAQAHELSAHSIPPRTRVHSVSGTGARDERTYIHVHKHIHKFGHPRGGHTNSRTAVDSAKGVGQKLSNFDLPLPPFDCVKHSAQSIIRWIPAVTALIIPLSNSPTPAYGFPAQTLGRVFAHCHSCGKKRSSGPKPTINPGKFKRSAPEQRSVSQCSWTMFCKTRVT